MCIGKTAAPTPLAFAFASMQCRGLRRNGFAPEPKSGFQRKQSAKEVFQSGLSEDDLFSRAAAVEGDSEHPLARVIVAEAKRRGLIIARESFRGSTRPRRASPCGKRKRLGRRPTSVEREEYCRITGTRQSNGSLGCRGQDCSLRRFKKWRPRDVCG